MQLRKQIPESIRDPIDTGRKFPSLGYSRHELRSCVQNCIANRRKTIVHIDNKASISTLNDLMTDRANAAP